MDPSRPAHVQLISILVYGLLCLAVVMQMLGTPTSLWTLDFDADLLEASLLEGFSLPPSQVVLSSVTISQLHLESTARNHFLLLDVTLFRPPSFCSPSISLT
jgi:hypothetical protein